jgi:uncharacterized membrane protein
MAKRILYLVVFFLLCVSIAGAAPENYKTTYTINVKEDGTAIWNVEYRTLLSTKEDFSSFENYTQALQSVYLEEFKTLMVRSTSIAAAATSRRMIAGDFTGDAAVQSSPTGTYGVVHYSFQWTNFARKDTNINIGDAFVGGLYLSKDNTLIIQYPSDYSVEQVTPQPDQIRDGLIWYGLRSFGAGEPRIVLTRQSFPYTLPAILLVLIAVIGVSIYILRIRRNKENSREIPVNVTEADMMDLEDRIVKLLKESGGSLYQSEIGRRLDLPKSTVSSALNGLQDKNTIQKIKKGRENMIRLV